MTQTSKRWLFGPVSDLFLGCGLIYVIAFVGLAAAGSTMRSIIPLELTPLILLVTGIPHYGATLLRAYGTRADRRRYVVFGVWASALVWLAFVVGVYEFTVGSLILTIYLTWSPWHYSGQNFGIAMMFLRRRGIEVSGMARRCLHWSFILSFLLTAVAFHGERTDVAYAPGEYLRSAFQILPLGIPATVVAVVVPLLTGAYLGCLGVATMALKRGASWGDLTPTLVLAASQALWFSFPMLARHTDVLQGLEPFGTDQAAYAFLWIAVAHAVQYVWITTYYAEQRPRASGRARYLTATLLAGAAIWVVPSLLFAPGLLGNIPYDAGLGALVAATVNIHHFVLDGAIWKLRDGKIASVLLRGQPDEDGEEPRRGIAVWTVAAIGIGSTAVLLLSPLQISSAERSAARRDLAELEAIHQRMTWLGRESALTHVQLALVYQRNGQRDEANRHVEAAMQLHPDYGTLQNLGTFFVQEGRMDDARRAIRRAYELRPESRILKRQLAQLLITTRPQDLEALAEAVSLAEQVVEADPTDVSALRTLVASYASAGRPADALRIARLGLDATQHGSEPHAWFEQRVRTFSELLEVPK